MSTRRKTWSAEERHPAFRGVPRPCPGCGGGLQPDEGDGELCFSCSWEQWSKEETEDEQGDVRAVD